MPVWYGSLLFALLFAAVLLVGILALLADLDADDARLEAMADEVRRRAVRR